MKNFFEEPYIEIIKLSALEVIATSGDPDLETDGGDKGETDTEPF